MTANVKAGFTSNPYVASKLPGSRLKTHPMEASFPNSPSNTAGAHLPWHGEHLRQALDIALRLRTGTIHVNGASSAPTSRSADTKPAAWAASAASEACAFTSSSAT
jgi:hypothetical protein